MFKGENWEILKYAVNASSKIFTSVAIINTIIALVTGTFDASQSELVQTLAVIFVATLSVFIFEKAKVKLWLKYTLSYTVIVLASLGIDWLLTRDVQVVSVVISTTILYVIIVSIAYAGEVIKEKKKRKIAGEENAE